MVHFRGSVNESIKGGHLSWRNTPQRPLEESDNMEKKNLPDIVYLEDEYKKLIQY